MKLKILLYLIPIGLISYFLFFYENSTPVKYTPLTLPILTPDLLEARLHEGAKLFQQSGCVNCHHFQGNGSKMGLNLDRLSESMNPGLAKSWIENPKLMKPSVKMPKANLSQEEILSILYYLYQSKTVSN